MHANTHQTASDLNQTQKSIHNKSLLSLINEVKSSLETNHTKRIEDLEYKILEKDEIIGSLESELNNIRAQNEEKDIELFKLHEEINASKTVLEQLLQKLGAH
ncbi:hypothetical protein LS73_009510 [Helicobacter muridarum]|uniref:DUF904 domain-containing protein n=1 Tax=Helicobacter muridarum TaxID=216 RepID=A0A099TUM4_9HELI|nr:hypothetical protein [Helicobacter muridarum]TLD98032.1 hypothetical protein LS73_009510 [Helicobacter muridarum]STQ87105.1 Uncharacterised protein [Helicobacter muridarum]